MIGCACIITQSFALGKSRKVFWRRPGRGRACLANDSRVHALAAAYVAAYVAAESDHALAPASRAANHSTACLMITTPGTADKKKHRTATGSVVCCKM